MVIGRSDPERRADPDRVLLLVEAGRDRELLADWLETFPGYEVLTASSADSLPEYDLCVVHESRYEAARPLLEERKRAADPVYLPHLLLRPEPAGGARRGEDDPDWTVVDDVVTLPADQAALKRRVENLLQARRASLRLVERETQYRQLVELTPEGILLVEDGEIVYGNSEAVSMLGVEASAALEGRSLASFVLASDRETLQDVVAAIDAGQRPSYTDVEFETVTGRRVPTSVAGVQVTYDDRRVVQLVVRDLTERREREQRLDLFGRAIDAAAQGITIADARQPDEPLVYANEAFERITGYGKDEVLGRNCRFLQGDNTDEATVARIRAAIDREAPVSVELLNYRRDGTPFWNALDVVPVAGEDGTVTHYLGLQRDVTARKEREQRLAVLDRVLRHNLRNRTNVIRGYVDLLGEIPDDQVREEIRDAADDLLGISERVRNFRSVVTDDESEATTIDLADAVREAVAGHRGYDDEAVDLSVPESAPIRADETLTVAIRDLIELADPTGEGALAVAVRDTPDGAVLEVTDRSGAFDLEELQVVAGDLETPLEHLQGIDLWLVRWSVEQSDGEFTVGTDGDHPVVRLQFLDA